MSFISWLNDKSGSCPETNNNAYSYRALAPDAQLYFMDEPMAGVDAATERVIFELLR